MGFFKRMNKKGANIINSFNNSGSFNSINSVTINGGSNNQGDNHIKGNGIPKTISVTPEEFRHINIVGSADVDFTISDKKSIEITADSNLIDLIVLSYSGDSLDIDIKRNANFSTNTNMVVKISNPVLQNLCITGSGDALIAGLDQEVFAASINGSGDIDISGKAGRVRLEVQGSGDIDASALFTDEVIASILGSGDIEATAKVSADTTIMGSGDIRIYGNPSDRKSNCMGSGKIKFK